jgi:GNAT superfamily N-acetyltransferase
MPEHRGKGVGKILWKSGVFTWCKKQGFTHLGSTVMAHIMGAIEFYESLGFHMCGYHRKKIDWDGELLDSVEIEMILPPE